ncbi:molybdenum cofactor biosynthesis protein MoaE [Solimicrobium silvestre]|uniref:Molybdopterin synthase catalytic subunit n=1 Tax=Solimicrobium silvestre TaxID=2099400 RepID=A0A2S9GXD4_9BURK|nr:molybdenum cofactor biosynthesis protein MoaE [Solimicrobium silvestre]PRC92371.1 Molybdopterin converting factor large subunit [Solimicrobium silvestre]
MKIAIQTADFDVSAELAALRAAHRDIGAIVSFVGTVREANAGSAILHMELEHYPGMTEKSLVYIVQKAEKRWEINDVVVIHRIGVLPVCAQIVLVAVASKHRGTAFEACEFIMDYLKTEAPFWKKEVGEHGAQWVDARSTDLSALDKWE